MARRPEVPALLAELGLAGKQIATSGARPLIYSEGRLHPLPKDTVNGIPSRPSELSGLVDDATIRWMLDEPRRPFTWRPGADPTVADLVGDRFGEQVVIRSVDPLLSGVYAGSAATIGIRAAAPTVATALDRGAGSLTEAVRRGPAAAVDRVGVRCVDGGYTVLVDELVRRSGLRWAQVAVRSVHRAPRGWELVDDEGARWPADAVVLAVPAPRLPALIADLAPRSAAAARKIQVASAAVVALALPGGTPLPEQSGVLVGGPRAVARQGRHAVVAQVGPAGQRRDGPAVVRTVRRLRGAQHRRRGAADVVGAGSRDSVRDLGRPGGSLRRALDRRDCRSTGRRTPSWSPRCGPGCRRAWRWRAPTSTGSGCLHAWRQRPGRRRSWSSTGGEDPGVTCARGTIGTWPSSTTTL